MITNLSIPEIHCISCEALIRMSLKKLPGIKSSNIDYKTKKVTIEFNEKIVSKDKIAQQITKETGYKIS